MNYCIDVFNPYTGMYERCAGTMASVAAAQARAEKLSAAQPDLLFALIGFGKNSYYMNGARLDPDAPILRITLDQMERAHSGWKVEPFYQVEFMNLAIVPNQKWEPVRKEPFVSEFAAKKAARDAAHSPGVYSRIIREGYAWRHYCNRAELDGSISEIYDRIVRDVGARLEAWERRNAALVQPDDTVPYNPIASAISFVGVSDDELFANLAGALDKFHELLSFLRATALERRQDADLSARLFDASCGIGHAIAVLKQTGPAVLVTVTDQSQDEADILEWLTGEVSS